MADTTVADGLKVKQWDSDFFTEVSRDNRFAGEFGTAETSLIQVREDLTKKPGDRVVFALANRLTNEAVTGSNWLEGNEEQQKFRSFEVTVNKRRNGTQVAEIDEQYSAVSIRQAAKFTLKEWAIEDTENLVIRSMTSINGVRYSSASEAQKDAWLVDNADRVLFGKVRSNNSANDHSASLANLDTTNDLFNTAAISKMKTIAETIANPRIKPVRSTVAKNGRKYFIIYAHPYAFDDLKSDTALQAAQKDVVLTMENERLFEGGDLYWDGCIIKKIEQASSEWNLGLVGNGANTTVVGAFLCGAQAFGAAYAKRWQSKTQTRDYGDKYGVAIESIYGIEKMRFGSGAGDTDDQKDHGIVTGWFATAGLS
ncbi:N4-gp56 family major capsid protein [Methylocystis sp. S23]